MNFNYKGLRIELTIRKTVFEKREYDLEEIKMLDIIITKKDGKTLYLTDFFLGIRDITDEALEVAVKKLINNIDYITYSGGKFIGFFEDKELKNSDELEEKLRAKYTKEEDENLREIYKRFFTLSPDSEEYNTLSYFLSLNLNKPRIPDAVRDEYLKRMRHSILDYDDESVDKAIREDFNTPIIGMGSANLFKENEARLASIREELKTLNISIRYLCTLLSTLGEMLERQNNNKKVNQKIDETLMAIKETSLLEKNRRILKQKLKELRSKIKPLDVEEEMLQFKCLVAATPKETTEFNDLLDMVNRLKPTEIYDAILEVYNAKEKKHIKLTKEYDARFHENEYYGKMDASKLYDELADKKK